ncbi:MAG: hypothetical protein ACI8Z9_002032 [Paraglaciecola sp.]|jgi:hypothetical protein
MDLATLQQQLAGQQGTLPPVEQWNPDFCGDIDMVIKHDGSWHYMGTPIGRKALVKLFSSVLKKEAQQYFLVTPVEKVGIQVIDSPFIVTQWQQQDDSLIFTTQTEDSFVVSQANPVELHHDQVSGDLLPYALVRSNLWARIHQNVFYQLAELGTEQKIKGQSHLCLQSAGYTFSLGML